MSRRRPLLDTAVAGVALACGAALIHRGLDARSGLAALHGAVLLVCGLAVVSCSRGAEATVARLAATLVAGQVASLLVWATPPYAIFPHLEPLRVVRTQEWPALLLVGIQGVVVLGALVELRVEGRRLLGWMRRHPLRFATLGLLAAASVIVPRGSASLAVGEFAAAGALLLLSTLNAALLAKAASTSRAAHALVAAVTARVSVPGGDGTVRRWDRHLPIVAATWSVVVAAAAGRLVFEGLPHIDDSVSYLFHARYLATGQAFLPAPPDSASFAMDEVLIHGGRWFGYGFPGWPAVLALGARLRVEWLVNPLLAGGTVLLTHVLVRRAIDRGMANAAALLLGCSPWFLFMSAEFMPHPLSALLALVVLIAAGRLRSSGGLTWAVVTGLALGGMALVRPLDAALIAVAATAMLVGTAGTRRLGGLSLAGAVAMACSALAIPYNRLLTGQAAYTPQMMWTDGRWGPGADRFGFGPSIGIRGWPNLDPLPGHGLVDVVLNLNKNLFITNADLLGWSLGSLLLVFGVIATLGRRDRAALPWVGLVALFAAGYSAYWFSGGPDLGARYWYPALPALVVLTVLGAAHLARTWALPNGGVGIAFAIGLLSLAALILVVPTRAVTKYHRYRGVGGDVRALADSLAIRDALVFIRSGERARYQSAFSLNAVPLTASTIFARDAGEAARARVVQAFPGRPVWTFAADSTDPWRVVERPDHTPR